MKKKTYVCPEISVYACQPHQMIAGSPRANGNRWVDEDPSELDFNSWEGGEPGSEPPPFSGAPRMNVWDAPVSVLWEEELLF